jgi:hypothetical protein
MVEGADNLTDQSIRIWLQDTTKVDLGTKNKVLSVTQGGANAQANGGNESLSYQCQNFGVCTVQQGQDPSGL